MDIDLKSRREQFIRGHGGGSFVEVVALTSLLQLSHMLFSSILFVCPALLNTNSSRINTIRTILDYVTNIVPFLLSITICSNYVYHILIVEFVIICANFYIYCRRHGISPRVNGQQMAQVAVNYSTNSSRMPYVSNLMSCLLLATSIAILAVDFPLFDRRFAKTELYGWSLMDVGVGGFLAINGALSPESRLLLDPKFSRFTLVIKSIRSAAPLLILGLIRLISVKSLNYQEHITEYGVHWNFFFTIAFSKFFSSLLCFLFQTRINLFYLSTIFALAHQYLLTYGGFTDYILSTERTTLIDANKEGLISTIGSVCLYLFFVEFGRYFIPKRTRIGEFAESVRLIAIFCAAACGLMYGFHYLIEATSRRQTNFAFICFMVAFISVLIIIELYYFYILQVLATKFRALPSSSRQTRVDPLDPRYQSPLVESLGRAGLWTFLAANLLTGMVNLSIDTLQVTSSTGALIILLLYCAILTAISQFICKNF